MKQILKLVFLLVIGQTAFGQAPSNYTNINGRYRWIAGMFDSTFHIPKGSTPSLRTGGSTNSGGLFYNTSDSSVYTYTGTQWIKLRGSINPSDTTNKYVTQVYKKSGSDSIFYVKGGVHTWAFNDSTGSPGGGGGGKVYYFNGGVDMGTIGGLQMYELGDTANTGAAANFTRSTTGNIANFITDPGKPGLLEIPAGVWSVDAWLSETGGGANHAEIWVEVEKWDGSTITTIATSPIEQITEGATPNLYSWSVSIPTTSLTVTDRIIIQFYISNTNGKTVTLYTQNGYVGEVHTTFTTGIGAINGLTAPAQYLVTGTSGTDFNINSSTATHTFNLPTASATNRGALSTTDWSTFNNKIGGSLVSGYLTKATGTNTIDTSQIYQSNGKIGIGRTNPTAKVDVYDSLGTGVKSTMRSQINTDVALDVKTVGNRGFALIIDQADSVASGTQYQTLFRKSMMPGTGNPANGGGVSWYTQIGNDNNVYRALSVYRARVIDSTGFANSNIQQTSTEFWTRKAGVWDTTLVLNGGNVGINTGQNGIDSALTVANGTWLKRGVRMSALPTGVGTKAVRIDANGTLSVADTLANGISGTGTTNYIPKFTSSSAIGNSIVQDLGTGISVGGTTTSNGYINNQASSISSSGGMFRLSNGYTYFVGSSIGSGSILGNGDGTATIQARSPAGNNGYLIFETGAGSERMRLDASGNLGIGTSSPDGKLHVLNGSAGTVTANGNADELVVENSSTGGLSILTPDINTGYIIFGSPSDNEGAIIRYNQSGALMTIGTELAGGQLTFRTGAGTERMRLDASGNLGLGVTPSTWNNSGNLQLPNTARIVFSGQYGEYVTNAYYDVNWKYYSTGLAALYAQNAGKHIWYTAPSGTVGNAISFTQPMTLDATGNLGLGVTSPTVKLHIVDTNPLALGDATGSLIVTYETGTTAIGQGGGIYLGIPASGGSFLSAYIKSARESANVANSATALVFGTRINGGSNTERMRITSGGNVGIGTSSPTQKLEVAGVIRGEAVNVYGSTDPASTSPYLYNPSLGALGFGANGSERMRITSTGNVGIGTTSLTSTSLGIAKSITGGVNAYGVLQTGSVQSDVTTNSFGFFNQLNSQSATFTLSNYTHYYADQNAIGVGNTITNQYGFRVASNMTGATSNYAFYGDIASGSGRWNIYMNGTANNYLAGSLGIGTTSITGYNLRVSKSITGAALSYGVFVDGAIQSDVTTTARIFTSLPSTQAAAFTLNLLAHYTASQGTIGATSAITNQYGFSVQSNLTGATNNYGFYGDIASGSGRWNLYMNGTANNYLAGSLGIGITSPNYLLHIGAGAANAQLQFTTTGTGTTTSDGFHLGVNNSTLNAFILQKENADLQFLTNDTERMRITSGGELLINTTSDAGDYKLQVNGNIYATGGSIINNQNATTVFSLNNSTAGGSAFTEFRINASVGTGAFGKTSASTTAYKTIAASDLYIYNNTGAGNIAILNDKSGGSITMATNGNSTAQFTLTSSGNVETTGSIKTAAPSGGTAAAWKLGERVASSGVTFNDQQYIQLDIGGTLYYLATVDLPMPEAYPQATSGPSNNYKMAPVQVKTTKDAEIEKLRKEIEELKQLIKNK